MGRLALTTFFRTTATSLSPPDDPRFDDLLDGGVASIGRLERALERSLNRGRRMVWCAVAQSKEEFNYKLTFEKVARLRFEGKIK